MSGSVPVCIFLHLHLLCHCGVPREKSVCVCVVSLNKAHFVRARHLVWCMHIDTVSQRMSDPNSYCIYADHRFLFLTYLLLPFHSIAHLFICFLFFRLLCFYSLSLKSIPFLLSASCSLSPLPSTFFHYSIFYLSLSFCYFC